MFSMMQGDEEGDPEDEEGPQEDDAQVDPGHDPRVKFPVGGLPLMAGSFKQGTFFLHHPVDSLILHFSEAFIPK